jgi:toxin ParE1/3/4
MAEVHLTRRALLDIAEIERYSVEQWGEDVAGKYIGDLGKGLDRLAESPALLKSLPDSSSRLRFYRVREHFLVCDLIHEHIYVLAVRHGSMDLPQRIAELEPQLVDEAELLHQRVVAREKKPRKRQP